MEAGRIREWECNICESMLGRYLGLVFEIGSASGVRRVTASIVYVLLVYIASLTSGLARSNDVMLRVVGLVGD